MRTVDRVRVRAPVESVFLAATDVERWPQILSHYRWVKKLEGNGAGTLVEMAAWRPFGPLRYPTWWVSEMWIDQAAPAIHYRHVQGITTGMDVVWQMVPAGQGTDVTIVHQWGGPRWPLIGGTAANWVIGPVFVHGIASRTLAGIKRYVEAGRVGRGEAGKRGSGEVGAGEVRQEPR
jgi:uncharacterized membrane protein